MADSDGVRLFRAREEAPAPPTALPCGTGPLFSYLATELSADGRTRAFTMSGNAAGLCSFPPWRFGSSLQFDGAETDFPAIVRISPSGRRAIAVSYVAARPSAARVEWLDPETGQRTPVVIPQAFPNYVSSPASIAGRVIADDGTAILNRASGAMWIRPGEEPQFFDDANFRAISADGRRILFARDTGLFILDRGSRGERQLIAQAGCVSAAFSDDGSKAICVNTDGVLFHDGTGVRMLARDVQTATLSGDGRVVYAATKDARLIRIQTDSAAVEEVVPRSPYVSQAAGTAVAGLVMTIPGAGLGPETSVDVNGNSTPVYTVTPSELRFFVPWDSPVMSRVRVGPSNDLSPFDAPEVSIGVDRALRAGAIAHQNWDGFVTAGSPPRVGEIIHVFAVGLGAVTPEVPTGDAAPATEPLARLSEPLACTGHEVLYAGLAPYYRERVYQVDLRLGPTSGYQQVRCRTGNLAEELIFLSFLILP